MRVPEHRRSRHLTRLLIVASLFCVHVARGADLQLLFMGDNGHHRPEARFQELAPALAPNGIELKYTDRMVDLNADTLKQFDGLVLYANIDSITDAQAEVVLDYVAGGKGFVPLHCATFCWRNNADMVALMGGQFQRHGGQVFTTQVAASDHPIMRGYGSFTSWDETYIHHLHNEQNRTVLEYRVEGDQAEGEDREPWTWVRTHGKGRVFYTAWGHDQRTFSNPGFHNLVERGMRWACGDDPGKVPTFSDPDAFAVPKMTLPRTDVADFEFVEVGPKIPNYTPGQKWGVQGKPRTAMQKPLSAEESIRHFVTPEGMAVRLYADERNFQAKPIAMNWDERGRLWICETVDYPNELGGKRDRIRICEDTDGDHVADKFTVFAEGLSIPTAIMIFRGGAVVQNGTETIYLKDTNGDDVADEKTALITNWVLGDTHGGVSNFRYGLDNWVWAMQGYNNSTPHVNGEPTQTFRMGFWRFKLSQTDPPKVTDLEFIRSSNNNTWGLGLSEDGLVFGSTANHNPSMFVPIPNRYYERVRGWAPSTLGTIADTYKFQPITENVRQVDQFGGYTAGAGHALYTARAFPQQWWNRTAFVCGPTGHLVGTFVLRRDGADYKSTSPMNLLASVDEWSAPIMAEVGPDGAVWVLDWYNYIVQHNPTPQGFETGKGNAYVSDLRDRKHGRIYRVVATGSERDPVSSKDRVSNADDILHDYSSLKGASDAELVTTLKHPSMLWRLQAQRLLVERSASDTVPALLRLMRDTSVDAVELNVGAIHALHTLNGLGVIANDSAVQNAVREALRHPSNAVRRNAVSVLPASADGLQSILAAAEVLLSESDDQVRLHTVLRLADMPRSESAGQLVAQLARTAQDSVIIDAATSAAAAHALPYLQAVSGQSAPGNNISISSQIAEHVARGKPSASELEQLVTSLQSADGAVVDAVLDGLTNGLPSDFDVKTTDAFDSVLVSLLQKGSSGTKSRLVRLATQCGTEALDAHAEEIVKSLLDTVSDVTGGDDVRIAAARDVVGFRADDEDVAQQIVDQLNAQIAPELGSRFLQTLQLCKTPAAGDVIVEKLPGLTPGLKSVAIGTLLSRPEWVSALLTGIESHAVEFSELSLDQKQALRSFPDRQLRRRAEKLLAMGGGLPDANRDKVLKSLLHLADSEGNVESGQEMFKKHCSKCHVHGEIGKTIGPNLTGMAVHPKAELLTHIIDPSRSVEGNFRIYTVVRKDGRVANGMLAAETRTSITLIDTEAKEISIQREDIEELLASRKSLMPEGFEKQATEDEISNLLQFLTNKGKYVPIPLDRYATAISTKGMFHSGDNGPDRVIFPDWKPKIFKGVPFVLTDPRGKTTPNIILLNGPQGPVPPKMPKTVSLPCNTAAKAIHFLSGVGGWSHPAFRGKTASVTVRLHYADQTTEDHPLLNGVHFADYIRRVDVPGSEFAFSVRGQQVRFLSVTPKRSDKISTIELLKGDDPTAPIVVAITIER
ncbi:MAG: c-type cytochrome [Fuerstiella sp.]|nr:c-type cytochrome [Fuerstiella sp.]